MDTETSASIVGLIFAWGAPLVLLAVITIRFFQRRARARSRRVVPSTGRPGTRRTDRVITDGRRIAGILASSTVCRLALAADGEPYIVPLSFGVAGEVGNMAAHPDAGRFRPSVGAPIFLYFHGAPEGRKMEIIRAHPRACVEVEGRVDLRPGEEPCDWTVAYESVIAYGTVHEVSDRDEKLRGIECIMRHHGAEGRMTIPEATLERTAVLRLDVAEITGKTNRAAQD